MSWLYFTQKWPEILKENDTHFRIFNIDLHCVTVSFFYWTRVTLSNGPQWLPYYYFPYCRSLINRLASRFFTISSFVKVEDEYMIPLSMTVMQYLFSWNIFSHYRNDILGAKGWHHDEGLLINTHIYFIIVLSKVLNALLHILAYSNRNSI